MIAIAALKCSRSAIIIAEDDQVANRRVAEYISRCEVASGNEEDELAQDED